MRTNCHTTSTRVQVASHGGGGILHTVGFWMMILGGLLTLCFVPCWLWPAVLGILLVVIGFLLWIFF